MTPDRVVRLAAFMVISFAVGVIASLVLGGCATTTTSYSRDKATCQDQAVDLAWRGCFGRTDRPPDIWWVPPAAQDCGRVVNGARGFMTAAGCAGGSSWGGGMSLVDFHGGWQATALAHECAHAAQQRQGLPPDMAHATPAFQPGGVVEQCNTKLAAAKLCGPS